jgi:alpha-tubulin suppressor-like RCC1 family protein
MRSNITFKDDNSIYFTGNNSYKQAAATNVDQNHSHAFHLLEDFEHYKSQIKKVSVGGWHNHCLLHDGTLLGWGYNLDGRVGVQTNQHIATPVVVPIKDERIVDVSGGEWHTLALTGMFYTCL